MDFTSYSFLLFVCLFYVGLILIHRFGRSAAHKMDYIIYCSLLLYTLWYPPSILILAYVIVITTLFSQWIYQRPDGSRLLLFLGVVLNLLPLLSFKYIGFFQEIAGLNPINSFSWILPLGISFYVFTAIAYLADIHSRKETQAPVFKDVALLISYWPHLAAGPILRSSFITNKKQLIETINHVLIGKATVLIAGGAAKKVFIADNLGAYVNHNFATGIAEMDALTALLTIIGFGGQIYADFSGYSEMAIGFSMLMGYQLPANFNYPYVARSITEFWHRWHISLSTWFRDYVYIPLGGNRRGTVLNYTNIMIVFLVSGLWHGAALNFVVWGGIHGLLLIIHRVYRKTLGWNLGWFAWLLTFVSVSLAWSFFRLDIDQAVLLNQLIFSIEHWRVPELDSLYYVVPIVFFVAMMLLDHVFKYYTVDRNMNIEFYQNRSKRLTFVYVWILFTLSVLFSGESLPFIYFEF